MLPVEVVPAILRNTYEGIEQDWKKIVDTARHMQIDITDGVFAGDGSFRDILRFKKLPSYAEKLELHMMVQTPANVVDDVISLQPARCIFHVEAFAGGSEIQFVYEKLRQDTKAQLALAVNPATSNYRLEEHLPFIDYVLFMGYNPGWAGQALDSGVYEKIADFHTKFPDTLIAVDGHVDKGTIEEYVKVGARILCANSAIFNQGDAVENFKHLQLLANAALSYTSKT